MNRRPTRATLLVALVLLAASPGTIQGQLSEDSQHYVDLLKRQHPGTYDLLLRIERAHGLMFGALAEEGEVVRASGTDLPTFEFEFDMVNRLTELVHEDGPATEVADEAEAGFKVLGDRAAAILSYGNQFHREVLGILADTTITDFRARGSALSDAVTRYSSQGDLALPTAPKNMDVLYEHPQTFDFRSGYADLDGLIWAGHWYSLAATEPLTDRRGLERTAGLDTVAERYYSKLTYGEAPAFFPTEIPLAPAIAPTLVLMSSETAMVWDNLTMLEEVLADILASPDVEDVQGAIDDAVDFFMHPTYALTTRYDWELMALRHGIFFQGGYPLSVMTESELNVGGHAAHILSGGFEIISGMGGA